MKLVSFMADGRAGIGRVEGRNVIDLTGEVEGATDLSELLAVSSWVEKAAKAGGSTHALEDIRYLPVNASGTVKVLALGWAYQDHAAETNHAATEFPMFFSKFPQTLAGHEQPLKRPDVSDKFDFEGEIAVVIGRPAHRVSEAEALDHIAGYTILMDGSIRDWQKHSVTAGKNFAGLTPVGPYLVTPDEAGPHDRLRLQTRLNGQVMQNAITSDLIWSIPYLISYCSTFCRLEPGDIISTGTPGGVGAKRDPQVFMRPGDRIEVEVSGIGVLSNPVVAE
ncbi:MAG: 5-carboxymethyl-2-hydroxymuconate isomerase [Ahrensia sp.]|nr:5-carboxymethyl-2-hydroxymuconate isomerase [Ahrensia sp.]|tara:strand:- start:8187 stop:9023 length:837 start_codon:yes stop_codon:yes gene_type:complete